MVLMKSPRFDLDRIVKEKKSVFHCQSTVTMFFRQLLSNQMECSRRKIKRKKDK